MKCSIAAGMFLVVSVLSTHGAHGYAPVIQEMQDIIIGDAENSTGANVFVFPDCIDLNAKVSDDLTSDAGIIWSYSTQGGVYALNGAEPVDPAVDDLVNPPAGKRVDLNSDPLDTNGPRTLTARDNLRSPLAEAGGIGPYSPRSGSTDSGPAQVIDSRVVTLYASDGSTVSLFNSQSFIIYTKDNGFDAYSEPEPFEPVPAGWLFTTTCGNAGGTYSADGFCIGVGLAGDNDANWSAPYGILTLAPNSVWEARLTVTTSQTMPFTTPFWMLIYDNYDYIRPQPFTLWTEGQIGHNEYGGETMFLDNEGGANSPIVGVGRSEFRSYLMPIAMQTPQFSNPADGFLNPNMGFGIHMRVIFRIMDYGSSSYGASADSGTVCLKSQVYVRHDLSDMAVDENVYSVDRFVNTPGGFKIDVEGQPATIGYNPDGSVTISPQTDWNTGTHVLFRPGDIVLNLMKIGTIGDNFPIAWEPDSLYYIEYLLSSPNAADEISPPDVIRVGADTATNELLCDHFAVPNTPYLPGGVVTDRTLAGVSMPRFAAPQKYGCFFYTHSVTKSQLAGVDRWRPKFEIITSSSVKPLGRKTNIGGINVHSLTVKKVHFLK